MLKTLLIIVGGVVVLAIGYMGWVISQAMRNAGEKVSTEVKVLESQITIYATLNGSDATYAITEIRFPREWGVALGVSPPTGYTEQPYTLQDTADPSSPESVSWVNEANSEDYRWVGAAPLAPNSETTLTFPIKTLVRGAGELQFQYERKIGFSGNIAFFNAQVQVDGT